MRDKRNNSTHLRAHIEVWLEEMLDTTPDWHTSMNSGDVLRLLGYVLQYVLFVVPFAFVLLFYDELVDPLPLTRRRAQLLLFSFFVMLSAVGLAGCVLFSHNFTLQLLLMTCSLVLFTAGQWVLIAVLEKHAQ